MITQACPSGLVLELRPLRGSSIIALSRSSSAQRDDHFAPIFSEVFSRCLDPGPYPFVAEGDARPPWDRILKGDMLSMLFAVRRISLPRGEHYDFPVRCEGCGKRYDWQINIETDLPPQPLPEASREAIRNGRPLSAVLSDGTCVSYHLGTFARDKLMREKMKGEKRGDDHPTLVDTNYAQVVAIDDATDQRKIWRRLNDMTMPQLVELRQTMDANDCGVETLIATRHDRCGWEQERDLPLDPRTFLAAPSGGRKPAATSSSSTETASTEPSDSTEMDESNTP